MRLSLYVLSEAQQGVFQQAVLFCDERSPTRGDGGV